MMKSQKGMTMVSLILYIASFLVVTATIGTITTFFYSNIEVLDNSVGSNSQYNKLNLYLLTHCKDEDSELLAWREDNTNGNVSRITDGTSITNKFITFKNTADGTKNSFIYDNVNQHLYYNSIRLCEDVQDFKIKVEDTTGKTVLKIFIKIDGTTFSTEYVINS